MGLKAVKINNSYKKMSNQKDGIISYAQLGNVVWPDIHLSNPYSKSFRK